MLASGDYLGHSDGHDDAANAGADSSSCVALNCADRVYGHLRWIDEATGIVVGNGFVGGGDRDCVRSGRGGAATSQNGAGFADQLSGGNAVHCRVSNRAWQADADYPELLAGVVFDRRCSDHSDIESNGRDSASCIKHDAFVEWVFGIANDADNTVGIDLYFMASGRSGAGAAAVCDHKFSAGESGDQSGVNYAEFGFDRDYSGERIADVQRGLKLEAVAGVSHFRRAAAGGRGRVFAFHACDADGGAAYAVELMSRPCRISWL